MFENATYQCWSLFLFFMIKNIYINEVKFDMTWTKQDNMCVYANIYDMGPQFLILLRRILKSATTTTADHRSQHRV